MEEVKFDESKRIANPTGWKKWKWRLMSFGMALSMAAGAVLIGAVNGIPVQRIAAYCLVAWVAGRPVAWVNRLLRESSVVAQKEAEEAGDAEKFADLGTGHHLATLATLLFSLLFWIPLRWGIVYATALGWL